MPKWKAQQVMLDLYRCDIEQLRDIDFLKQTITQSLNQEALDIQYLSAHDTDNTTLTVVAATVGKHITLHAYPEQGFVAVDIFSCSAEDSPEKIALHIKSILNPDSSKMTYLQRGTSATDMKPRRKSHTKPMRRVKKAGEKVLQVFQKNKK